MKFGADLNTARHLLETAQRLGLEVIGVRFEYRIEFRLNKEKEFNCFRFSFHCGSGQMTSKAFVDAIQNARITMDYAIKLGFNMSLLDIGGGFPGNSGTENYFTEIATAINRALDEHFPNDGKIRIIAEPGRYYVASAYTLATSVIAVREMKDSGSIEFVLSNIFLFV